MKRPLSVILIFLFIISIVGNITLYLQLNKVNSNNQDLNNSIVEIQNSISDLENQLSDLQQQLSDSTTKNGELQEKNDSLQSELEFLQSIEPMSVTMYALEDCDTYSKPDESSDKITTVEKSASLHVTGRTCNDWYRVEWGNGVVYIKASLLSDTKPTSSTNTSNSTSTTNNNSNSNSNTSKPTNPAPNNSTTTETQKQVQDILNQMGGGHSVEGGSDAMGLHY